MLAATALSLALALAPQAPPSLKPLQGESDCISSNGAEAPNHFQAPLAFAPKTRDKAFVDAARLLRDECTAVDDGARYVQARCEGDVVELLLRDDVAAFAWRPMQKGITPPWCIENASTARWASASASSNSASGSMNRQRMSAILKLGERLG